jgi:hypothetical protein
VDARKARRVGTACRRELLPSRATVRRCSTRVTGLVVVLLGLPGCTRVSDRSRFEGPDETLEILTTSPKAGEQGVDPEVRIDLCLSGRVDPRSLDELDATVSSGGAVVDSELSVQLVPWLAPGRDLPPDDVDAPWCGGSVVSIEPRAPLVAGAGYRMRLQPSAVGWAGEPLSTEGPGWVPGAEDDEEPHFVLEFTVEPNPRGEPLPRDPAPATTLRDLFAPGGPLDPARPTCSCHRDPDHVALRRLDLRDPQSAYADLLGSSAMRDTGFAMVAPRRPSESFLVHKLLRDPEGEALYGVLGDAMPPEEPLPYADLLAIVQWILDGAEP